MEITKKQFNNLATKTDLNKLDKRVDKVEKKLDKVYIEQLIMKEEMKKFATKDELAHFRNEVLTALDKVVKKLDDIEHAFVSNQAAHDRFEKRITRIEKHLKLESIFD